MSQEGSLSFEQEWLDILSEERRNDLMQSTRDKFLCLSRSIENKALMICLERPRHDRPYGLPASWSESGREQIWEYILQFVDERQDIVNMSETCNLFQRLLKDKYKTVRLAEAVVACMINQSWLIPPDALLDIRLVSHSAKNFIDENIIPGKRSGTNKRLQYLIPGLPLKLDATRMLQPRLHHILTSLETKNVPVGTFPVKKVALWETGGMDLPSLRGSVQRLFELVGTSIHSFAYITVQNSHDSYNILRGWASLLLNLEEIIVTVNDNRNLALIKPFEPFPTLPRLKRYWENNGGGFNACHLSEILRSNPTLELVKLSRFPESRLDTLMTEGIVDHHQLKVFVFHSLLGLAPFHRRQVNWPLTKLQLYLTGPSTKSIHARTLFRFVNQFGATLNELIAYVILAPKSIYDPGDVTMMNLPNLVQLLWFLQSDAQPLRFMIPLKNLEYLDLSRYGRRVLEGQAMLKHLEGFRVPNIFPAMRRIRVGRGVPEVMEPIWECGKAI